MLRGFFFLLLFTAAVPTLSAQENNFREFEWDLFQLGFASSTGNQFSGGLSLGTEVRYNINNRFSTGLNFDLAFFGTDLGNDLLDVGLSLSYSLTGDYYFVDDRTIRPFAGFGIGRYGGGSIIVNTNDDEVNEDDFISGSSFGVSPRVGIELSHLRIALEYNLAFNDRVPNYIGLTFAPTLWGGLKKKNR